MLRCRDAAVRSASIWNVEGASSTPSPWKLTTLPEQSETVTNATRKLDPSGLSAGRIVTSRLPQPTGLVMSVGAFSVPLIGPFGTPLKTPLALAGEARTHSASMASTAARLAERRRFANGGEGFIDPPSEDSMRAQRCTRTLISVLPPSSFAARVRLGGRSPHGAAL